MTANVMIDIETLGTDSDAFVVQIGALAFDPATGDVIKEFSRNVTLDSNGNGNIDPKTLAWWLTQDRDVMASVFDQRNAVSILQALFDLQEFFVSVGKVEAVWANDPTFDLTILENRYASSVIGPAIRKPWHFRQERSCRTAAAALKDARIALPKSVTKHDALSDCRSQAAGVVLYHQLLASAKVSS